MRSAVVAWESYPKRNKAGFGLRPMWELPEVEFLEKSDDLVDFITRSFATDGKTDYPFTVHSRKFAAEIPVRCWAFSATITKFRRAAAANITRIHAKAQEQEKFRLKQEARERDVARQSEAAKLPEEICIRDLT